MNLILILSILQSATIISEIPILVLYVGSKSVVALDAPAVTDVAAGAVDNSVDFSTFAAVQ